LRCPVCNCTLDNANSWKERLQLNIQARGDVPSLSIGIAQTGPEKYVTSDEFIHQADQEMYMVKKSMKNA